MTGTVTRIPLERVIGALDAAGLLVRVAGALPDSAAGIGDDSRSLSAEALFVAVRGVERDGHDYLPQAAARGATAVIVEDATRTALPAIVVRAGRQAAAVAASAAFDWPARSLRLIGVTGTNGKTTTVGILRHLLDGDGGVSASIGTLGVLTGSAGALAPGGSGLTTPGPIELQRVLRHLVDSGVRNVAMEVSSHSLDQRRVDGLVFDAALFTNLTRDHLDYHATMDAYLVAKARLVDYLAPDGVAIVNADDPAWEALPAPPRRIAFSAEGRQSNVLAREVAFGPRGSSWTFVAGGIEHPVRLPLIGSFNVANALGAAAAAWALGASPELLAERLGTIPQVPGRLEILSETPTVLRDYAHTPDALARALDAVRPFTRGRLIAVFGCGGDRDRGKRPEMGRVAVERADLAIATSDNPRTEDPERILDDIEAGMGKRAHERVTDRRAAIEQAIARADDGDVVVLAGKGHETYQIRGAEKFPFDEKEIVAEILGANGRPPR
ncbi:MAG: UDP-N-acetylmuramoyl-L-alanyl-D-glutamate--2,6-diaminopimelate ligase [Gemmatimonadaceae bacterium]